MNIGKRVKQGTHELSSGRLESRVADIGGSGEGKERKRRNFKERICDRREESGRKINLQDFFYIYCVRGFKPAGQSLPGKF